ncbi:hypothetical protein BX661DRAFT_177336 [Kickxella alabastrina]|uniref:uncharacterized protein n=1 Tax=Kickxella alabastrina TaxID=61397 RepID=UPI00221FF24C|nr:uncharacterized protein BX661DRAFT_177336 [Kickxella alabastrina]KAI7833672.1 hypothetical protein BX661DRAFT_177336 [Kickxella alabastrina]
MSTEVAELKRIYIGGFTQTVTDADIRGRFTSFGQVDSVDLPSESANGAGRGFGFVNIQITPSQWHRCASIYTGAKWKGGKLKIEEAKEDYKTRMQREREQIADKPEVPMAENMDLVTAKNVERYPGWSKGRYNRPVFKFAMLKDNGKQFTYDPVKYKNNFEKLFGSVRPKNWKDLQWEYSEEQAKEDFEQAKQLPQAIVERNDAVAERLSKRQRLEADSQRCINGCGIFDDMRVDLDGGFADDSDIEGLDADEKVELSMAAFEDAEEIASLVASASSKSNPELLAKLSSGVFDSDSEDDWRSRLRSRRSSGGGRGAERDTCCFAVEAKAGEYVAPSFAYVAPSFAMLGGSKAAVEYAPKAAVAFDSEDEDDSVSQGAPQDGAGKKSASSKKQASESESASSDDSDPSSDSGSGNDNDSSSGLGDDGSSDDDSDSDTGNDSSSNDDDDSSDDEDSKDVQSNAMEVDDDSKTENKPSSLFGGSSGIGGGLFGALSGGFKFTEALGLEADEPSAMALDSQDEDEAPITGGARLPGGPIERNLNANRLPMFFPDTDAMTFRRPEPVFQRQKTEDELEADLESARSELTREYKAQHRSTVRKTNKMRENRRPRGTPQN